MVDVRGHGSTAIETHLQSSAGKCGNSAFIWGNEPSLEILEARRPLSFDGDGSTLPLVSEDHGSKNEVGKERQR